ncbi:hypothetical protein BSL78_12756 [Apostichopus japonicus]|uniref:Stabilizer of axonemal microtubules 2 n=1 Tax=Stichopus japonicus TaxID=307972 RepID=A0A2G8KQR6_STIJA|nr:hypothetical protein BSL78_12756 [Apostichopus japonicus]
MVKRHISRESTKSMDSANQALLAQNFPSFNCICELCHCGCITRQKHSKTCRRQPVRKQTPGTIGHHKDCLMTHYQQVYKAPGQAERTLPLIPPPTPRDPNPPPMQFATTQRSEYRQHGEVKRTEPIKLAANYERSQDPVDGVTAYKESFPGHTNLPRILPIKGRPPQQPKLALAAFDARTSHKEQFRKWNTKPVAPFTDLPSFAGELQSTSQYDFPGRTRTEKPEKMASAADNIVLDGDFDHETVHKKTYTDFGPGHKAHKFRPVPKMTRNKRGVTEMETQHMRDFPVYKSQPEPASAAEPPEATIRLSVDSRLAFTTEQRNEFKGHDTSIHRKRDMMKQGQEDYRPPNVKFESLTSMKAAFQPKDTMKVERITARRPTSQTGRNPGTFDDRTTNKKFYQNWGAQPRVRYGDLQEGRIYIPPADKMEKESWNQSSYKPVKLPDRVKPFKPEDQPINEVGTHDFKTVHKETYVGTQPPICKAQAYLMQQELLRQQTIRRNQEQFDSRGSTSLQVTA